MSDRKKSALLALWVTFWFGAAVMAPAIAVVHFGMIGEDVAAASAVLVFIGFYAPACIVPGASKGGADADC